MGSVRTGPAPRANTVGGIEHAHHGHSSLVIGLVARPSPWARSSAACSGTAAARRLRPPSPSMPAFAADRALTGIAADGGTDTRELERAVRERPDDARSLVLLGYAYQQRWRETADASNLPRSEAALRRASRLDPTDALAVIGLGSLALIRHDFRAALAIGRRAAAPRPVERADVRPRRRCAARARPVRGCLPRVRAHGRAPSERRLVRAHRVRPRAARRPGRRASGDAACGRRRVRAA